MTHYFAIIPAAGKSLRFASNIPKQYVTLQGIPILEKSIQAFLDHHLIEKVVVVLNADDQHWQNLSIANHPKILTVIGGELRSDSVINGLKGLASFADSEDWVLVHDGARPFINISDISNLIEVIGQHKVGGILGVPLKDTLKKISAEGEILSTVDRSDLWHAQTPQMFRYELLKKALERARANGILITDDCSAIEMAGYKPLMVLGPQSNSKITFADDIEA